MKFPPIKNINKAVQRLILAKKQNEKIAIWGDYDADGIAAATILYEALSRLWPSTEKNKSSDGNLIFFLPSTDKYGYGLTKPNLDKLIRLGIDLLVTVDFGTNEISGAKYLKKNGIDLIILDHHLQKGVLPDGIVVNVRQKGDKYPFKEFAAAGIVLKFIESLYDYLHLGNACVKCMLRQKGFCSSSKDFNEPLELVDLAALATVTDRVLRQGENLDILKRGLNCLNKGSRPGIKILTGLFGIKRMTVDNLGKIIDVFEPTGENKKNNLFQLFTLSKKSKLISISERLILKLKKAMAEIESVVSLSKESLRKNPKQKFIFIESKAKITSVVAAAAVVLKDKYRIPVFVYRKQADKILRGSCRALGDLNLVDILSSCEKCLLKYGGHKLASGFSLYRKNLDAFKACLEKWFQKSR